MTLLPKQEWTTFVYYVFKIESPYQRNPLSHFSQKAISVHIDCCAKFATGLKCSNRHRSKSMRVSKLFFCQIDPPMSASFWQKNRLDTQILFDLCLFEHFSPVANFAQQSIIRYLSKLD